jgi:glucose/arabinose dehydrogenase/mono/diheme cytochrome c family protein
MKVVAAGTALLGACTAVLSLAASQQPDPAPLRFADAASKLYGELCASCHGAQLQGAQAPSLVDDIWTHGSSDDDLARSIRDGWPANGMPAFGGGLSAEHVRSLVVYIREMGGGGHPWLLPPGRPPGPVTKKSERHGFRLETLVAGLDTPWGIDFLPDGRLIFTDRVGLVRTIVNGTLDPAVIGGVPSVWVRQDGGLMDIAVHPQFAKNGWIYLSFVEPGPENGSSTTRVIRARIRHHQLVDQQSIFQAPPELYWVDNTHYGSRFIFDSEGYLYFSLGDRGRRDLSQDLSSPYGKLHRVHDDGRAPADNPFVDTPDAVKSIWSYGHRNPQGFAFHPVTGELWSSEHGPRGGDELNVIERGRNYGWPVVTDGIDYDGTAISLINAHEGMEPPIVQWTPTIAPAAVVFYTGDRFPHWRHHLFIGTLAGEHLRRIETSGRRVTHQEVLFTEFGRVRDVTVGPDGYLYLALNGPGRIARLVPAEP